MCIELGTCRVSRLGNPRQLDLDLGLGLGASAGVGVLYMSCEERVQALGLFVRQSEAV